MVCLSLLLARPFYSNNNLLDIVHSIIHLAPQVGIELVVISNDSSVSNMCKKKYHY